VGATVGLGKGATGGLRRAHITSHQLAAQVHQAAQQHSNKKAPRLREPIFFFFSSRIYLFPVVML